MIDSVIVKPFLRLSTWLKRHPMLAALLIVVLFLIPPIMVAIYAVLQGIVNTAKTVLGIKAAEKVYAVAQKVAAWLTEERPRVYYVAAAVGIFAPILGFAIALWHFLDRFKSGSYSAKLELDGRDATTTTPPPAGEAIPEGPEPEPWTFPDFGSDDPFGIFNLRK